MSSIFFEMTGQKEVDDILNSIINAGDSYTNIIQWSERDDEFPTHQEIIQNAANRCADKLKKMAPIQQVKYKTF
jgi:hypothetical protein